MSPFVCPFTKTEGRERRRKKRNILPCFPRKMYCRCLLLLCLSVVQILAATLPVCTADACSHFAYLYVPICTADASCYFAYLYCICLLLLCLSVVQMLADTLPICTGDACRYFACLYCQPFPADPPVLYGLGPMYCPSCHTFSLCTA